MTRRRRIYEGKGKILYEGPEPGTLVQFFKDDATAFNKKKHEVVDGKGVLNNRISEYIFSHLNKMGIPTHFIRRLNMREQLIKEVEIIPLEVVVRNIAAGSLAKRLGIEEGTVLPRSIIEFYYKADALDDPMVSEEHITAFGWASPQEIDDIMALAIRVNDFLSGLFLGVGIQPPLADWGTMVRDLAQFINFAAFAPQVASAPLLAAGAIALLTVAVNFVVDWMLHRSSGLKE